MGRLPIRETFGHIVATTILLVGVGAISFGLEHLHAWAAGLTDVQPIWVQATGLASQSLLIIDLIGVVGGSLIFTIKSLYSLWKE